MNWMTILWPMVTGACITLAMINLVVALGDGKRAPHFFFALSAWAVAGVSGMELLLMRTADLAVYDSILRWAVVPMGFLIFSLAGFVRSFFGTGRTGLALAAVGLNAIAQTANLVTSVPAVRHAVAIRQVETFGDVWFTVPVIVNGPWNLVLISSVVLLIVFVADASVSLWKKGQRRRAAVIGGSIIFFLLASRGHAILVERGLVQTPYLVSFSFVAVLMAMGYELSREVLGAAALARSLHESEQRMTLAAETARLGMWVWDAALDEVWLTETGRVLFGFSPGQRIKYQTFLERVHPDDRAARDAALKQSAKNGKTYGIEYRVLLPDGTLRWIASRGGYIESAARRGRQLMGVSMDITVQKQAELRLNHQREEIAHLGRISMMGQLSSALAHELNQPLGAILRNAEAAEIFLESDNPDLDELRSIVTDIRKDDQRAGEVIDRLRGLLKRRDIELIPASLDELLGKVMAIVRADAASRQVEIKLEIQSHLKPVLADPVHIQQVLLNLLFNAMDAMKNLPGNERTVKLEAAGVAGGLVEITVGDRGHGIPLDQLSKIFEPFFTTKTQGMGMGLAISQTIVEAHGGKIRVENGPKGGAIFRFTLKAQREELVCE